MRTKHKRRPMKTTATNITGEAINEVDGLFAIARGLEHVAYEIRDLGERTLMDAVREVRAIVSEKATEVIERAAPTVVDDAPVAKKRKRR